MSVQDLITKWEDALAQALQESMLPEGRDLSDADLEKVALAGVPLRSQLRAGEGATCRTTLSGPSGECF